MDKLYTHDDNLKVSRDAPLCVIKAAYKVLAQENHPDRCADPKAPRRMQIINDAYAVLSSSSERAAHDKWIAANEKAVSPSATDTITKSSIDRAYVDKLHASYRTKLSQKQQAHAAEIAGMKRVQQFEKVWGILLGLLFSIPIYTILSDIDTAVTKAHAEQDKQYQEASMLRH
jgi:DnaJ-class molecular chaperone